MGPNSAADALEIGERHSSMPKTNRSLDQFLGMACAAKKGVVARDGEFTP
jgi:hypothetical protein